MLNLTWESRRTGVTSAPASKRGLEHKRAWMEPNRSSWLHPAVKTLCNTSFKFTLQRREVGPGQTQLSAATWCCQAGRREWQKNKCSPITLLSEQSSSTLIGSLPQAHKMSTYLNTCGLKHTSFLPLQRQKEVEKSEGEENGIWISFQGAPLRFDRHCAFVQGCLLNQRAFVWEDTISLPAVEPSSDVIVSDYPKRASLWEYEGHNSV